MTVADEGTQYTELFDVIKLYATRGEDHQAKALDLIAANFTPFRNLPHKKTRQIVEDIFKSNNYLVWFGGRPSLIGINAIVTVAKWGSFQTWGQRLLWQILSALSAPSNTHKAPDMIEMIAHALEELASASDYGEDVADEAW